MSRAHDRVMVLGDCFRRIHLERMRGLPLLNERLVVETVGFQPWQGRSLGVLITPWFMNLILLPSDEDRWQDLPIGAKMTHPFPSGDYEFILADESSIGRYQLCSLFSPMFDFADQAAAVATAEAVMEGLMDERNLDHISMNEREIERRWRGEPAVDEAEVEPPDTESPTLEQHFQRPLSRRELLRGAFSKEPK